MRATDDFKHKAKKAGFWLLDKAGDVIGICLLALAGIIISIATFLFTVFMWFIAVASFCWILCLIGVWLGNAYFGH